MVTELSLIKVKWLSLMPAKHGLVGELFSAFVLL